MLECWGVLENWGPWGRPQGLERELPHAPVGRHSRRPFPVLSKAWRGEPQGRHLEVGLCVAPAAP